ncbi:MAG: helix-turn-helix transcriptional regulator [Deltaproteobacteria bacterium]|nr:helix-turn-helix transcriptional regulator [Deltaproteobacteria bacterium]
MPRLPRSEHRLRRTLAANVHRARQAAGLTLEEAADRAGMHWRHWQKIEAGEVNATLRTLARLAGALGTPAGALLA